MKTFKEWIDLNEDQIDPLEIAQKDFLDWMEKMKQETITENQINFNKMSQIYRRFATRQGLQMSSYAAKEFVQLACNLVVNHMDRYSKHKTEEYLRKLQEYCDV